MGAPKQDSNCLRLRSQSFDLLRAASGETPCGRRRFSQQTVRSFHSPYRKRAAAVDSLVVLHITHKYPLNLLTELYESYNPIFNFHSFKRDFLQLQSLLGSRQIRIDPSNEARGSANLLKQLRRATERKKSRQKWNVQGGYAIGEFAFLSRHTIGNWLGQHAPSTNVYIDKV